MIKMLHYPGKLESSNGFLWTMCCLSNSHFSFITFIIN
jgi:hypothetical protein